MAEPWAAKFYNSKAWRDLRNILIIERGPRCQMCGRDMTFNTNELIGHHKKELTPDNINDPAVALNPDNILLVCHDCHNKEHGRYGHSRIHQVYLVYGPPCSGKTTLIKQLANRGDLIVNIDSLYKAISGMGDYDKPDNLRQNVLRVGDLLIDQIAHRYGKWNNAYIEGGYPFKVAREELAKRTGATMIFRDVPMEECLQTCEARGVFADEWKGYVKKWFSNFQP